MFKKLFPSFAYKSYIFTTVVDILDVMITRFKKYIDNNINLDI